MRVYKVIFNKVILSDIFPCRQAGDSFHVIVTSIKFHLANLCSEENIGFVNTWDHFYYDSSRCSRDGLHLSQVGRGCSFWSPSGWRSKRLRNKKWECPCSPSKGRVAILNNAQAFRNTKLNVFYVNARSLHNKFSDLEEITFSENYNIINVTKSWLNISQGLFG